MSKPESDGVKGTVVNIGVVRENTAPSQHQPTANMHEVSETWRHPELSGRCYGISLAPPLPLRVTADLGNGPPSETDKSAAFDVPVPLEDRHASKDTSIALETVPSVQPNCEPDDKGEGSRSCTKASGSSSVSLSPARLRRERIKAAVAFWCVFVLWAAVLALIWIEWDKWERDNNKPDCKAMTKAVLNTLGTCEACGSGTILLPLFGEYEKSWPTPLRGALYLFALIWIFLGMGLVCDQFMTAIEEITSSEHTIWKEVTGGARHKFHLKVWNPTVANLTLMALGSSAPEILLSATELMGNDYFAGKLGPSTIVGSAAFNLLVISAVCVSAIPAPFTTKIKETGVFCVTTIFSILAYIWLLVIVLIRTPEKIDLLEGILTLAFFPIFVCYAFAVDKGWCRRKKPAAPVRFDSMSKVTASSSRGSMAASWSMQSYGSVLREDVIHLIEKKMLQDEAKEAPSKAKLRKQTTGLMTGGFKHLKGTSQSGSSLFGSEGTKGNVTFGFQRSRYTVMECAGLLHLKVVASAPVAQVVHIRYRTVPGTAAKDVRYKHTEGFLAFGPGTRERIIEIPIIDNDKWEPNEEFSVELIDLKTHFRRNSSAVLKGVGTYMPGLNSSTSDCDLGIRIATVTVIDDDEPGGVLGFPVDEVQVTEGTSLLLNVARTESSNGTVTCKYETADGSAIAGKDYQATKGILTFDHGERHKTILISILASQDHRWEADERFSVKLTEATGGAVFDKLSEGGLEYARCDVLIAADKVVPCHVKCFRYFFFNRDRWGKGLAQWREQVEEAMYCGGSAEEQAQAGLADWAFHILCLFWKLLFSFVPPPLLMGGWLCFSAALVMIGFVTAVTGDVASLLGCCLTIPDNATAITLVALGTSLPDTFASRTAAQQDGSADNAIGNITGSNSVNVFLGIGISWTMGAVYWGKHGKTTKWLDSVYEGESYRDRYEHLYSEGGFVVPAGSLSFTVAVFILCATVCLTLLCFRRKTYGGELGGPASAQRRDAILLVCLWVFYIVASLVGDSIMPKCDPGTVLC